MGEVKWKWEEGEGWCGHDSCWSEDCSSHPHLGKQQNQTVGLSTTLHTLLVHVTLTINTIWLDWSNQHCPQQLQFLIATLDS